MLDAFLMRPLRKNLRGLRAAQLTRENEGLDKTTQIKNGDLCAKNRECTSQQSLGASQTRRAIATVLLRLVFTHHVRERALEDVGDVGGGGVDLLAEPKVGDLGHKAGGRLGVALQQHVARLCAGRQRTASIFCWNFVNAVSALAMPSGALGWLLSSTLRACVQGGSVQRVCCQLPLPHSTPAQTPPQPINRPQCRVAPMQTETLRSE